MNSKNLKIYTKVTTLFFVLFGLGEAAPLELVLQDDYGVQNNSVDILKKSQFFCSEIRTNNTRATSVHALRPSDIDIIAAIGDSLTAANGAKARLLTAIIEEDRGVSWCMGGEKQSIIDVITLPNILRQFNPNLYGFSTGTGKYNSIYANLNLAQPGHTSHEMLEQARELVERIQSNPLINVRNTWKMITFFIGGNDLCKSCDDIDKYSVDNYVANIKNTLDYFRTYLPKTLVNLVLTLDVSGIETLTGRRCLNIHNSFCKCGISSSFRSTLNTLTRGYQRGVEELIYSGRYDVGEEFTVVLQPFMKRMKPPVKPDGNADFSYFAPDCFHFSEKGHKAAAIELWNTLFVPVGKKAEFWTNLDQPIRCPSAAFPFIRTNKNSNL